MIHALAPPSRTGDQARFGLFDLAIGLHERTGRNRTDADRHPIGQADGSTGMPGGIARRRLRLAADDQLTVETPADAGVACSGQGS